MCPGALGLATTPQYSVKGKFDKIVGGGCWPIVLGACMVVEQQASIRVMQSLVCCRVCYVC